MSEAPEGWASSTVGQLCNLVRGVSFTRGESSNSEVPGTLPIIRAGNLSDDGIDFENDLVWVPAERVSADQRLRQGDIVVATSSGSIRVVGKSVHLRTDWDGAHGAFMTVLRPTSGVDPAYVAWYVRSPAVRERWSNLATGTNINNLKKGHLEDTPIPVPPLPEQRRIVAAIEEHFSRLDAAEAALTAAKSRIRLLTNTASQRIRNLGAETFPFGDLVDNHDGQRIPVKASDRAAMQGQYPYYGASGVIDHVDDFLFDGTYLLVSEDGANLLARTKPIAFEASGQFWVNNHAHVVQACEGLLQPFLAMFLNSIDLAPYVTGSAQPKITQRNLNKIPVPVPTLRVQREVVDELETLAAASARLRREVGTALSRSISCRRSILAAAFSGQLVPRTPPTSPHRHCSNASPPNAPPRSPPASRRQQRDRLEGARRQALELLQRPA